jgi:hypothetical protein
MDISATQLTLFFSISSLFFSTPPDKFFPDSASTSLSDRVGFAIFAIYKSLRS